VPESSHVVGNEAAVHKLVDRKSLSMLFRLALRLLWRDWQGGELRLLFIALVMAVSSVSGIALFTDRLEKALLLESANMLAADRVMGSGRQPPQSIIEEALKRPFCRAPIFTVGLLNTGTSVKPLDELPKTISTFLITLKYLN